MVDILVNVHCGYGDASVVIAVSCAQSGAKAPQGIHPGRTA